METHPYCGEAVDFLFQMRASKQAMCRSYTNAKEEVEIELTFRTPMFRIILQEYVDKRLVSPPMNTKENVRKYYNERDTVLRNEGPRYELKSRLSTHVCGPYRVKMSIERRLTENNFDTGSPVNPKDLPRRKLLQHSDNTVRNKLRYIVRRPGYEIHFTIINGSDAYIEFELTNSTERISRDKLLDDLIACSRGCEYDLTKIGMLVDKKSIMAKDGKEMKIMKPIELTRNEFRTQKFLTQEFYITDKLDGIRLFLIVSDGYLTSLDTKGNYVILETYEGVEGNWVFDTEYYNDTYHVFDVLVADSEDISNKPDYGIMDRMDRLNDINLTTVTKIVPKPGTLVKNQRGFYNALCRILTNNQDKTKLKSDGVIIYNPSAMYCDPESAFKFKFVPTIDVQTDFKNIYVNNNGMKHKVNISFTTQHKPLNNMVILECEYDNGKLKIIKSRPDKLKPNSIMLYRTFISLYTANKILTMSTINPDSDNVYFKQVYINQVKSDIIKTLSGQVLDIGSGRGGDIYKWKHNRAIKNVDCVEPNSTNYKELLSRNKAIKYKTINVFNTDFDSYKDRGKCYDYITALLMLNCVPHGEISKFFKKLYNLLKPKGSVWIIMMDSNSIKHNKFIEYAKGAKDYVVDFPGTMVLKHKEYTYTMLDILKLAEKHDFTLDEGDIKILNSKWLSGINRDVCRMYFSVRLTKG